jgi:hypothetical protein
MIRDKNRDYTFRYLNWEVIASYLVYLNDFQEVFRCFNFPSKELSPQIIHQFKNFLNDINLPKAMRKYCGRRFGGEPGLGRVLDQMVFFKIFVDIIEQNESDVNRFGSFDGCTRVTNDVINKAVALIVANNEKTCDIDILKRKENIVGHNYKQFQYSKPACNRFIHRWSISNRYVKTVDLLACSTTNQLLAMTDYAVNKGYPVDGWPVQTASFSTLRIATSYSATFFQMTEFERNPDKFEANKNKNITLCSSHHGTFESNKASCNKNINEPLVIYSEGQYIRTNRCL